MSIPLKAFLGLIVFLCLTILTNAQSLNDYKLKGKVKSFYKKTYEDSKDGYLDTITPSESIFVDFQNLKETKIHKKNHRINKTVKYFDENLNIVLDSVIIYDMNYVDITKYYYNSKGKLKKEIYKDNLIENFIVKRYKYKPFSKDYTIVYSDNSNIENVYYKYDVIGNLVEERHPSYLVRFEYEYYE